jgi:hypothetical protein
MTGAELEITPDQALDSAKIPLTRNIAQWALNICPTSYGKSPDILF